MSINCLLVRSVSWQKSDLLQRLAETYRQADALGQKELFYQMLFRLWFDLFPLKNVDGNDYDNPEEHEKAIKHEKIMIRFKMWSLQREGDYAEQKWWHTTLREEFGGAKNWQDAMELELHQKYQRIVENREPEITPSTTFEDDVKDMLFQFFNHNMLTETQIDEDLSFQFNM